MRGMVRCDTCGKVVQEKNAHGWYSLRTVTTKLTPEQMSHVPDEFLEITGYTRADVAEKPVAVAGEFCTLRCLVNYCGGTLVGDLNGDSNNIMFTPDMEKKEVDDDDGF